MKIKMKIAMCSYYQGNMREAMDLFSKILNYYKGFEKNDVKV